MHEVGHQVAFATAQMGLAYHSLAQTQPALYEAAVERYEEALAYFRQEDVRAQVWRMSGLLAQALFRSPVAASPQPGDPDHYETVLFYREGTSVSIDFVIQKAWERDDPDGVESVLASVQWL